MVRSLALLAAFAALSLVAEETGEEAIAGQSLAFPSDNGDEEMMEVAPPPAREEQEEYAPQQADELNDEMGPAASAMIAPEEAPLPVPSEEMYDAPETHIKQLPVIQGSLGDHPELGKAAMNVRTTWIRIKPEEVQPALLGEDVESAITDADRAALIASCMAYSVNSRRLEPQGPASLKYLRKGSALPAPTAPKGQATTGTTGTKFEPAANNPYIANNILDPLNNLVRDLTNQVTMLTNIVTPRARRRRLGTPAGREAAEKAAHFQWYMDEASKPSNSGYEEQRALLKELYVDRLHRYTSPEADAIFDQFMDREFETKVAQMEAGAEKRRLAAALYESPMNKIKRGAGILEQAMATRRNVEEWSPLWLDGAMLFLASYEPEGQAILMGNMREMKSEFEEVHMLEAELPPFDISLAYHAPMEFLTLLRDIVIGESLEQN